MDGGPSEKTKWTCANRQEDQHKPPPLNCQRTPGGVCHESPTISVTELDVLHGHMRASRIGGRWPQLQKCRLVVKSTASSMDAQPWLQVVKPAQAGALQLRCAATWPSGVARAAAVAGAQLPARASALLFWMAAALLPEAAVFTARSVTCA